MEFAKNMYELHKKVSPSEVIIGWYVATHANEFNIILGFLRINFNAMLLVNFKKVTWN